MMQTMHEPMNKPPCVLTSAVMAIQNKISGKRMGRA